MMFATFKSDSYFQMIDASISPAPFAKVKAGRYEIEEILNPMIEDGEHWLVISGTKTGMIKSAWRLLGNQITLEGVIFP
jgi:hypothetical protein